ncbi:MAG: F0F1 ATP synthase subunit alpha, partial [Chloroflexi bacterium]|nr:F0F1 ATP synthase subunit alpha [Chloroflexota bacterium]
GHMRLEMAQYRELKAFAQFGTDLDASTQAALQRGERMVELTKQPQHTRYAPEDQIVVLYAASQGYLQDVAVADIARFQTMLVTYLQRERQAVRNAITLEKRLTPELAQSIDRTLTEFMRTVWDRRDQ